MAAIIISPLNGSFQVSISLITNVRRKEHQDCFGLLSKIGILSRYSYSLGAKVVMGGRTDPRSTNWFPSLYLPKHSSSPDSGPVPYDLIPKVLTHAFLLDSLASLAPAGCIPDQKFPEGFTNYKALISSPASEGLTGQFGLTLPYQWLSS